MLTIEQTELIPYKATKINLQIEDEQIPFYRDQFMQAQLEMEQYRSEIRMFKELSYEL